MQQTDVLIEGSDTESTPVDTWGYRVVGIAMPDTWTSADLTFEARVSEGGAWLPVYDVDGNEITVAADADQFIVVNLDAFAGCRWLRLVSSQAQDADRVIGVVLRPLV